MRQIDSATVERVLQPADLVERLRQGFAGGAVVPPRHHHTVEHPGGEAATLLLMPAWQVGRHIGVKLVTVFPSNGERGLPAVMGIYLLSDAMTGQPLALIDGPMLTLRRTAAASALAASYLARPDAGRLLMVGTGALAPHLIAAHAAVRPIRAVTLWGRDPAKARALAERLSRPELPVSAAEDLEEAVAKADVISCATLSKEPLVRGQWLRPGQHLDLVGAFTPAMREADDEAVRRSRVFVDSLEGATREGGDIVQPLQSGALTLEAIQGDLFRLCRGEGPGRRGEEEITLFKSVGHALEDLVAAQLAAEKA